MARIGIDARFYGSIGKGLGRYTQKLIENLEKIDHENEYVVFLRRQNFDEYVPSSPNFQKVIADYQWYGFSEQFFFAWTLYKYKLDLVHFPHFNVPLLYFGKFVITIHDLILIHFPTVRSSTLSPVFYWFKFFAYKITIKSAIFRSQRIFAVSKFTKNDILETYRNVPKEKVVVTYEACDDYCIFSQNKGEDILRKYGIIKPYFLYIGNVYPHKNPERLVLAFKKISQLKNEAKLVFVGGDDYFYTRLRKYASEKHSDNVFFAGFVPDGDLDELLRNSLAYIRPSLYEGFELPPLEAMAKGVPVLCSKHECALEILEDSALYFDGENIDDIVSSIIRIQTDKQLRGQLIEKGYRQVRKYDWKSMAQKTLQIYENIR